MEDLPIFIAYIHASSIWGVNFPSIRCTIRAHQSVLAYWGSPPRLCSERREVDNRATNSCVKCEMKGRKHGGIRAWDMLWVLCNLC